MFNAINIRFPIHTYHGVKVPEDGAAPDDEDNLCAQPCQDLHKPSHYISAEHAFHRD